MNKLPTYTVRADYEISYPKTIVMKSGDPVSCIRKDSGWPGWTWLVCRGIEGWVPDSYLSDPQAEETIATKDFDGSELSAKKDDVLTVHHEESGWVWVETTRGDNGWFPLFNLKPN